MKYAKWIILFVFLVFFVATMVFTASWMGGMTIGGRGAPPLVVIQSVLFENINNYTLSISVRSNSEAPIVFNRALIKNQNGNIVDTVNFNEVELLGHDVLNFTLNLNKSLSSGIWYTMDLRTAENVDFHCSFGIPEKITIAKITLSKSNTLLLDVQSFADQPIVFDGVTIKEWIGNEFVQGRMGYIEGIVDTGILSQTQLLPHEKATLTVTLKNGVSCGNYSLSLHNTSPSYVSGAGGSFRVTGLEDCFNRVAIINRVAFDDVDNNTLLLEVKSMSNQTIFFNNAVVKESILRAGYVYAFIASGNPIPMELLPYENTTIAVSLKARQGSYASSPVSFRSGNYTVNLNSSGSAVWTSFAVP